MGFPSAYPGRRESGLTLLRALKRNWPFVAVVVQLVLIAVLSGWLAADVIFPERTSFPP